MEKLALEAGLPPSLFQSQPCLSQRVLQAPLFGMGWFRNSVKAEGEKTGKQSRSKDIMPQEQLKKKANRSDRGYYRLPHNIKVPVVGDEVDKRSSAVACPTMVERECSHEMSSHGENAWLRTLADSFNFLSRFLLDMVRT